MTKLASRPYDPADLAACLSLFEVNVPRFFDPSERGDFLDFLASVDQQERLYWVFQRQSVILACGGLLVEPARGLATMSWGMVDRASHGQGLGAALTQARIALARTLPGIQALALATSQHTRGFYERFGFVAKKVTPDSFGPGLDRWDMTLALDNGT